MSVVLGVGHVRIASVRVSPEWCSDPSRRSERAFIVPFESPAFGVGQSLAACPWGMPPWAYISPRSPSATGVGHSPCVFPHVRTIFENSFPSGPWFPETPYGVGHRLVHRGDEEATAEVRATHSRRREHTPLRIEPQLGQVSENVSKPSISEPWDVFQEDEGGSYVTNCSDDVGPDPSVVVCSSSLAGLGERLAREPRSDEIHDATPLSALEGREIVPDRCLIQGLVFHPRHEDGRSVGVALDVTHTSVSPTQGEVESELEPSDTGAEGESIEGT